MDQYKNQYKEETSQIHAPAALLERTRLAVAEEEKKQQAEKVRDEQRKTDRADHHRNYGRRYRWALSAAAAVILLFAVHRSALLWGTGAGKSSMDSASGMAASGGSEGDGSMSGSAEGVAGGMEGEAGSSSAEEADGMKFADTGAGEYAELQSAPAKTEDSASASREPAEDISGGRASGTAQSSGLNRDVSEGMADADRDDSADGYDDADRDNSADRPNDAAGSSCEDQVTELEKKYREENSASRISLTEVDKKPDFCDRTDTKRVVSQGITFYITENATKDADAFVDSTEAEKDSWRAYAEYKGKKYIMTGQAEDRDGFLEKACDTLMETAEGNSN